MTPERTSLTDHLEPGETLLWSGRPADLVTHPSDGCVVPVGIIVFGFAVIWESKALREAARTGYEPVSFFYPALGLPVVLFGAWLLFGRYLSRWRRRKASEYGVTERRILKREGGRVRAAEKQLVEAMAKPEAGAVVFRFKEAGLFAKRDQLPIVFEGLAETEPVLAAFHGVTPIAGETDEG